MSIIHVASSADPRLDDYRNIPDPELLTARGLFIAEGRLVVRRLLSGPGSDVTRRFHVRSVLVTPAAQADLADILGRTSDIPTYVVSPDAMKAVSGFNIHRGCLAAAERPIPHDWRALAETARSVVVLEGIANADNVGGIFRNALAFGVDAVLLGPSCADPLYRKAIRTSMGTALQVLFAHIPNWPADLLQLREFGLTTIALTPAKDALPISEVAAGLGPPARVALLLGHEGSGLTIEALAAADVRARIPTAPELDSLNVATAAAIALYEIGRSRRTVRTD